MTKRLSPEHASTIPVQARVHQGHEAGIVSRLIAAGLDLGVVTCVLVASYAGWSVALFVLHPQTFGFPRPSSVLMLVAYLVVATACLAVPWRVNGRSYGQHVMGLRVTTNQGDLLPLPRALLRAVICICFPIGLLWVPASRRNAAAHDLLVRTAVHYDWNSG